MPPKNITKHVAQNAQQGHARPWKESWTSSQQWSHTETASQTIWREESGGHGDLDHLAFLRRYPMRPGSGWHYVWTHSRWILRRRSSALLFQLFPKKHLEGGPPDNKEHKARREEGRKTRKAEVHAGSQIATTGMHWAIPRKTSN
eukprot:6006529-Amphidinium_carterae.1